MKSEGVKLSKWEGSSCHGSGRVAAAAVSPGFLQWSGWMVTINPVCPRLGSALSGLNSSSSPTTVLLHYVFHRETQNTVISVTAAKINCRFHGLFTQRESGFFSEVSVLCCHANVTKLLLDEVHPHPAFALAQAAPSWPLACGDSQQWLELQAEIDCDGSKRSNFYRASIASWGRTIVHK